jgi:hypothetical protein
MLLTAPAATAAYAPKLAIKLDPSTPGAPAAITSTITQASGETANKTVKVTFPAGFTANFKSKVTACKPEQEAADTCPADSQVGTATAETTLGSLTGPVFFENKNGQLQLVVYLKGFGGLISQKLIGMVDLSGRATTTFDGLPNTPTTAFVLALQGGDKALLQTPSQCGKGTFDAAFTSQNSEQATAQATVDIQGCATKTTPVVSAVGVSPRSFKSVRTFSDTQRPGYGATLRWTLSEATNGTRIVVQRRVRGTWTRIGSFLGTGQLGANQVKWDGRVHKRSLAPGAYRLLVQTTSLSGIASQPVAATFTVRG